MLSAIISTSESERALVPTLAALIPGAMAGLVSEVIVSDANSRDATREVADLAGCKFLPSAAPLAERLAQAAEGARAPWLFFLRAGSVPDVNWIAEASRFIEETQARTGEQQTATFRPAPPTGTLRPLLMEAIALLGLALGARAHPDHGLLIAKRHYQDIGAHRPGDDTERDLLKRIGRRRIVMLRATVRPGQQ